MAVNDDSQASHEVTRINENKENTGEMREQILRYFPCEETDIRTYSPLTLAFLGDAVFSLVIRTITVSKGNRQAHKLHDETKTYVSAQGQAKIADCILPLLSGQEAAVYKRGLNANPYHHAKNASWEEYRKATALEALFGWLYLSGGTERILELLRCGVLSINVTE